MRSRLFSTTAKPQALGGHLSQVGLEAGGPRRLGCSQALLCSPHCGPEPPHGPSRELSEAAGRQRAGRVRRKGDGGPVKPTNADASYLQRRKKTFPISILLLTLPLQGNHAHRQHGCALAPARLGELIHTQGKPKQHFH